MTPLPAPSPPHIHTDDASVTVRVQSLHDAERARADLNTYLFGETPPTDIFCALWTCTVVMQYGVESSIDLRMPEAANGNLVIYHTGHSGETPDITATVDALLQTGYAVAIIDMPLTGVNPPVTVDLPLFGMTTLRQHDHLAYLEGRVDGSPVRYFIEPVIALLDRIAADYERVIMMGISGGGWATTLASAIDMRIDASYAIAGSLPLALRFGDEKAWGDWEQTLPSLYAIADYGDLYALSAQGRRHVQLLNLHDPCCFAGDWREYYEDAVADAATSLGGSFQIYMDETNRTHTLSDDALAWLLADLRK